MSCPLATKLKIMNENKMSFSELKEAVKKLENEFNNKLVSMLNSCDEPVIITMPFAWNIYKDISDAMNNPLVINLQKEKDVDSRRFEYVYSASSTQTII